MQEAEAQLEAEIEELLAFNAEYELKLLRMLLTFGLATALVTLLGLVVFVRPEYRWSAFALIIADYFAWLVVLEFKRDVRDARELESDRYRLVLELRYRLISTKAARLKSETGMTAQVEPKTLPEQLPTYQEPVRRVTQSSREAVPLGRMPGSLVDENFRQAAPGQWVVTDEQAEHPAVVGISPEYPDPLAIWGMAVVRELHERMTSDYENGKLSDYAFVYGVVSGKTVSAPQWLVRGLSHRNFQALMGLLVAAGIVEEISQGKKSRTIYLKNPAQAYLVAYQKHKDA